MSAIDTEVIANAKIEHAEHEHNPHLAHHFSEPEQQISAAKLGMWAFLAQEVLFFGGLFVALMVFRTWYPDMYRAASSQLNVPFGAINTMVLICSSLTMALAVRATQLNRNRQAFWLMAATVLLAGVFLVIKYFEYSHKFHEGQLPGHFYTFKEIPFDNAHMFFGIYFCMTGLHGLHVLIGMIVIGWMMVRAWRNEFSSQYYTPVECTGLYWHLVDLIWIFLFPLLYLVK